MHKKAFFVGVLLLFSNVDGVLDGRGLYGDGALGPPSSRVFSAH